MHFKSGSDGSDFGPGDLSLKSTQPGDLVPEYTHFLMLIDISHEINQAVKFNRGLILRYLEIHLQVVGD